MVTTTDVRFIAANIALCALVGSTGVGAGPPDAGAGPSPSANGAAGTNAPTAPSAATATPAPAAPMTATTPGDLDLGPRAILLAGVAARKAGRWSEAVTDFRRAATEVPGWAIAHLELAAALLRTGAPPTAVEREIAEAKRLDPGNPRLYYVQGVYLELVHKPTAAAASYEAALAKRPSLVDARLRLGRLYLDAGRIPEAIADLEAAVRARGSDLAARANLAEAYEKAGDLDRAAAQLATIANMYPDNPYQLYRLARFYRRHGMEAKARRVMKRADALSHRRRRHLRPLPRSRR